MRLFGPCAGLLLVACGRIGFDLAAVEQERDAGSERAANLDGGLSADDAAGALDAGEAGGSPPITDAARDDALPPLDAPARDARGRPEAGVFDTGTPRDAGADTDASVDAGATLDAGTLSSDYPTGLPPLAAAPTIDGVLEPGLVDIALPPQGWTGGTEPLPAGFSATYAIAWRPDGLYFFVRVTDPSRFPAPVTDPPWCGDGVEFYVDHDGTLGTSDYASPGTRQLVMAAPADDVTPATRGAIYAETTLLGDWTSGFVAVPEPGGYTAEAFIGAPELGLPSWTLAEGATVGVDISVNVSFDTQTTDPCSQRMGQYFLSIVNMGTGTEDDYPYLSPEAFETPMLLSE